MTYLLQGPKFLFKIWCVLKMDTKEENPEYFVHFLSLHNIFFWASKEKENEV